MVRNARLPVLWLCGAPATGKSTVAWRVFSDLADQGLCVGYLDIDQIGMLQPPPDADLRGHRFKVDNLAGMMRNYRAAGSQVLVISGVIDSERGDDFAEAALDADITFCHLTVDEPTLRERLAARGCSSEAADEAVIMMSRLADASFVTTVIDTTRRDPVGLAREAARLVTAGSSSPHSQELLGCSVGDVTIVIGPRAVGKSSVSWGVAMRRWASGERTVYVDLDQELVRLIISAARAFGHPHRRVSEAAGAVRRRRRPSPGTAVPNTRRSGGGNGAARYPSSALIL
jgi:predicted kinase